MADMSDDEVYATFDKDLAGQPDPLNDISPTGPIWHARYGAAPAALAKPTVDDVEALQRLTSDSTDDLAEFRDRVRAVLANGR